MLSAVYQASIDIDLHVGVHHLIVKQVEDSSQPAKKKIITPVRLQTRQTRSDQKLKTFKPTYFTI